MYPLKLICKAVSVLCSSANMTGDSPRFWPFVWSWASHSVPLGHGFPCVCWAIVPCCPVVVSETRYLQDSEACRCSGVSDNKCTADTQLGHRTLYCPLLYLDGDHVRWFLVRMFLSAPGSTETRRRARAWNEAFCALQVGTEYYIWCMCMGLTCIYFINTGKRSQRSNVKNSYIKTGLYRIFAFCKKNGTTGMPPPACAGKKKSPQLFLMWNLGRETTWQPK